MAGRRIYDLATRGMRAIIGGISRFASAARRGLIRIGDFLYRGAVWIGVQLTRFILTFYVAFVLISISQIGVNVLYVSGVYDTMYLFFGMALLFFLALAPALLFRERHKSPLLRIVLLGLGVTLGGFVFSIGTFLHLGIRVSIAIASSLTIFSAGRRWLPDRIQTAVPIAAWFSLVAAVSIFTFLFFFEVSLLSASLTSLFVVGVSVLPLRASTNLSRISGYLYLILCVPSGTLLMYLISLNILLAAIALVMLPVVILHRQYVTALQVTASGLAIAGRYVLMILAMYIVGVFGFLSLLAGFWIVQWILPFLQIFLYSEILTVLMYSFIVLLFWLPLLAMRRADYGKVLSAVLVAFTAIIGAMTFLLFLPGGMLRAVLVAVSLTSILSAVFAPGIDMINRRIVPIVISMTSFLSLCLDLLALDILMTLGIASFCLSFLSVPFISKQNRIRIVFPIATTSLLGLLFYYMVLPLTNAWLALSMFVALDTLLLSIAPETRSWQIWWTFAISSGYTVSAALAIFSPLNIVIALFVGIELVRLTPDVEYRFSDYHETLDIFRAVLVTTSVWLFLSPLVLLELTIEICLVTFLIISSASLWRTASPRLRTGLADVMAIVLSLLAITNLYVVLQLDLMFSIYVSMVPLLAALVYSSTQGSQQEAHGMILRGIVTALVGLSWYAFYRTIESLVLSASTGLVAALAIALWAPWSTFNRSRLYKLLIGSVILLFEVIWVWHSILVL
ncbi:MAG: hypothetical protein P1Q69_19740, partial [Candidatus Thorarchaeota archaeon]|nr:hypothetical protein [Candidatus Thorarchaeota archaeon]